jgi:Fe2+ or Zn2+ uptake regulation protein
MYDPILHNPRITEDIQQWFGRLHWRLSRAHRSLTAAREAVYWALHCLGPGPVKAVHGELAGTLNRSTVNRTLKLFMELGIAERPRAGEVGLRPPFRTHWHAMLCEDCGQEIRFNGAALERALEQVARSRDFGLRHHRVELVGRCGVCLGLR